MTALLAPDEPLPSLPPGLRRRDAAHRLPDRDAPRLGHVRPPRQRRRRPRRPLRREPAQDRRAPRRRHPPHPHRQGRRPRAARARSSPSLDATQIEAQLAQLHADALALTYEIWRLEAEYAGARRPRPRDRPRRARRRPRRPDRRPGAALRRPPPRPPWARSPRWSARSTSSPPRRTANDARARSAERQLASWQDERAKAASLVEKGATPAQKLLEIDRNIALVEGDLGEARGLAAAAAGQIARTRVDIETLRQQRLVEAGEKLAEDRRRLAEVTSQIRGAVGRPRAPPPPRPAIGRRRPHRHRQPRRHRRLGRRR